MATASTITTRLYLPAMAALACAGCAIAASDLPETAVAAAVIVAIGVAFLAERAAPYRADWNHPRADRWRDVTHAVVNEGSLLATLALLPTLTPHLALVDLWPSSSPFPVQVVVAILVADLGITLAHRLSHHVAWLWRLHAVHHSVKRFYGLNGLMKHPLHQTIELLAGVAPLLVVGMPPNVAAALSACVAVQLLLQHSNVAYATGPLDKLLALNGPHRFHHVAEAGAGDVNFGLFTTIWDRWLLGTYHAEPDRRFDSNDLGIAGCPDYPTSYFEQLTEPFRISGRGADPSPVSPRARRSPGTR